MTATVAGSPGRTPKSRLPSRRDASTEHTTPAAMPVPTSTRLCRMTRRMTAARSAPSAIRTPISRVRRLTV